MKDQMQNTSWLEYVITFEIWSSSAFQKYTANFWERTYTIFFPTDFNCMNT